MLYEIQENKIPLSKEMEILESYLDLERLRYGERLSIHRDFQVQKAKCTLPPFIFLNLVENAFKHGVSESITKTAIFISIKEANGIITFCCKNPIFETARKPPHGIGLKNIIRRLELVYAGRYDMEFTNEPPHFEVNLKIDTNEI